MVLVYVTNRAIMERLDDICGKTGWHSEYRDIPNNGGAECGISVKIDSERVTKWDATENTRAGVVKDDRSSAMKRVTAQWGTGWYLYNLKEGFAQTSLDKEQGWHRVKLKGETGFYWFPPSLPEWAISAPDNKPSPESTSRKSPSADYEQIPKDFSDYTPTEADKKKPIERYQRNRQSMTGNEETQAEYVQVMNIRANEPKQVVQMASRDVNKMIILSRVGQALKVWYSLSGAALANLTIAASEQWRDKNTGKQKELTG